jgi:hypothetical protein
LNLQKEQTHQPVVLEDDSERWVTLKLKVSDGSQLSDAGFNMMTQRRRQSACSLKWARILNAEALLTPQLLNWHYMNFEIRAKTSMHLFTLKVRASSQR